MSTHIKTFSDGSILKFDQGKFDAWCVYFIENGTQIAPTDLEYFRELKSLAIKYGAKKIYDDFVKIYHVTDSIIKPRVLDDISNISSTYGIESLKFDKLFTILYAGMIAEENKNGAILKKRIKRLGMHQLLLDDLTPYQAANFSKGKKWRELDVECVNRGF